MEPGAMNKNGPIDKECLIDIYLFGHDVVHYSKIHNCTSQVLPIHMCENVQLPVPHTSEQN